MADTKPPEDDRKIVDVAHPGKTPPAGTSKPIIITNRPVLKDPMVVEDDAADKVTVTVTKKQTSKALTPDTPASVPTTPPAEMAEPAEPKADAGPPPEPELPAAPTTPQVPAEAEKSIAEAAPPAEATPAATTETATPEAAIAETPADDDVQQPPQASPDDLQAEAAKQAEHEASIQKLVEGEQYFLPINSVEKRRTKRLVIFGILLSVVLAAVWLDMALDAGLVHVGGLKPVTHFFSN